jgi:hypothetical protein
VPSTPCRGPCVAPGSTRSCRRRGRWCPCLMAGETSMPQQHARDTSGPGNTHHDYVLLKQSCDRREVANQANDPQGTDVNRGPHNRNLTLRQDRAPFRRLPARAPPSGPGPGSGLRAPAGPAGRQPSAGRVPFALGIRELRPAPGPSPRAFTPRPPPGRRTRTTSGPPGATHDPAATNPPQLRHTRRSAELRPTGAARARGRTRRNAHSRPAGPHARRGVTAGRRDDVGERSTGREHGGQRSTGASPAPSGASTPGGAYGASLLPTHVRRT